MLSAPCLAPLAGGPTLRCPHHKTGAICFRLTNGSRCLLPILSPPLLSFVPTRTQIGWRPLRDSWLAALPPSLGDDQRARINTLFEWLVDPCLAFVRKNCKEVREEVWRVQKDKAALVVERAFCTLWAP